MRSDYVDGVSVSPIWQLAHVRKGADGSAKPPYGLAHACVLLRYKPLRVGRSRGTGVPRKVDETV